MRLPLAFCAAGYYGGYYYPHYSYSYMYGHRSMRRHQIMLVVRPATYLFICFTCADQQGYTGFNTLYSEYDHRRCLSHLDCRTAVGMPLPVEYDRYQMLLTMRTPSSKPKRVHLLHAPSPRTLSPHRLHAPCRIRVAFSLSPP